LLLPPHAARTFPVNGTFTPPQRELYAALLATQKALVRECAVGHGHSLDTLHRRSVDLLRASLGQIGLPCAGPVLERMLYPHYLTHPIGIGESPLFLSLSPLPSPLELVLISGPIYRLARVGNFGEECAVSLTPPFHSFSVLFWWLKICFCFVGDARLKEGMVITIEPGTLNPLYSFIVPMLTP